MVAFSVSIYVVQTGRQKASTGLTLSVVVNYVTCYLYLRSKPIYWFEWLTIELRDIMFKRFEGTHQRLNMILDQNKAIDEKDRHCIATQISP